MSHVPPSALIPFLVGVFLALPALAVADFNPADVVRKTLPAVVTIRTKSPTGEGGGSGFLVDPSGTIVTNLHVIRGATSVAIRLSGGDVYDEVRIRAFDERKDLAILQVSAFGLPTLPFGNSEILAPGQRVVIVGNALGMLEGSVSTGVVSGIRTLEEGYKVIQTDATANHGNSGGPMLDENGDVVGVITFKVGEGHADNLNFAVPINYARGLLTSTESLSLAEFDARLGKASDLFAKRGSSTPNRWKSLASGTTKIVRQDGDNLYVETVLNDEERQARVFYLAELKKTGDRYIGKVRHGFPCSYAATDWNTLGVKTVTNSCVVEDPMEITVFTPSRIEGVVTGAPMGAKFNCKRCAFQQARMPQGFTWIPE